MKLPNFLIVGAAKAGTTALYEMLKQHPEVYLSPVKEPNFFALEGDELNYPQGTTSEGYLEDCITDIKTYSSQFNGAITETAVGEASPIYLFHPKAPERIQHYIPDVKLIVILRDPVERAYSNFLHHQREGLETVSDFYEALQLESQRMRQQWWWGFYYAEASLYYRQLQRYLERFDRTQIQIYLYEDLKHQPEAVTRTLFQFLGVDSSFKPDTRQQYNVSGVPKNKLGWSFLSKPHPLKEPFKRLLPASLRQRFVADLRNRLLAKPAIAPATRQHLVRVFREDILQLQELLQRDLSAWLEG